MISKDLYYSQETTINPLYFDGKVKIREIFNENNSSDQEVYFVEFSDGALTTVHYHETEQILIPLYGNGVVGQFNLRSSTNLIELQWEDYQFKKLKVGEIVIIPPHILHFHGAISGQNFSHVAIRKLYVSSAASPSNKSRKSQTKWAFDIIAQDLKSEDKMSVAEKVSIVSKKVREIISQTK
jgi:quercetin dioxygenase-like cupin family protein